MTKFINIFLASSIVELKNERRNLSDDVSGSITMLLKNDNIAVNFVKCEYNHAGNDGSRDQDYLNQLLTDCEYSVFLFKTHLGDRTEEEYNVARKLQKERKHVIFAYFLDAPENTMEQRLIEFRDNLGMDWEPCDNIDAVKFKLAMGLLDRLGIKVNLPISREEKFNQHIEMRQSMHQEIEKMLAEIEQIKKKPSDSVAAMIVCVIGLYREADRWASATDYNKERHFQLLSDYACFLFKYGLYRESKETFLRLIPIAEKRYGLEHENVANLYNNLGEVCRCLGDYSTALDYLLTAIKIEEKTIGINHPSISTTYSNIGLVYNSLGESTHRTDNYFKALDFFKRAMRIDEKVLGMDNLSTACVYNNIGLVYNNLGDDRALVFHEKALSIREKHLGSNHSLTALSYNNIGSVYQRIGNNTKALKFYIQAMKIDEIVFGSNHIETVSAYNNIGSLYFRMHKYPEALVYLTKALKIAKNMLGDNNPNVGMIQKWIDATKKAIKEDII